MSELKRNKMEKEKHPQPQFQHLTVPCVQQCGRRNSPLTRFNKFCLVPLSPLSVLRSPSLTGKVSIGQIPYQRTKSSSSHLSCWMGKYSQVARDPQLLRLWC
ncbi:hypothetical protein QN277_013773 [Acacia crassicarpa]|uniref:Uncharacterized protein n=1 Tax=Acacia crassicarpa TaxID=499986 RepID=A0AAE1N354_9FABA|nr:hypothetical protein QN277_013773 [Acacia crassicarpa]